MNTLEFMEQNMESSLDIALPGFEVAVFSRGAPGLAKVNEDAALICADADKLVAAIADGAGGYEGARDASRMAAQTLLKALDGGISPSIEMQIINAFERAHETIRDSLGNAATTFASAFIAENCLRTFHVGDSGALVIGGRGRLKYQTVAHSPTGHAVEAGTLNEDDALFHEDRYLVSNILGHDPISIEISGNLKLATRDTILLATDGLFDNLYLAEICKIACERPILKACNGLAEAVTARMQNPNQDLPRKLDDLTIILIRIING